MQVSNCDLCKHLQVKKGIGSCCPAFPDGIERDRRLYLYDPSLEGKVCNNGVKFEYAATEEKK